MAVFNVETPIHVAGHGATVTLKPGDRATVTLKPGIHPSVHCCFGDGFVVWFFFIIPWKMFFCPNHLGLQQH